MCLRFQIISAVIFLAFVAPPLFAGSGGDKEERVKLERMTAQLEELKTEIIVLQEQVQNLRDGISRTDGIQSTLLMQMSHNVSAIGRAQSAISTNSDDSLKQLSAIGKRLTVYNDQIEQLSEQFIGLQKMIDKLPDQTIFVQVTPGKPVQLFAVAYNDYSRGNYELSLSEFQQFVETYHNSELADNAQYWIGEIYLKHNMYQESLDAFARVVDIYPKADKATVALFKRAIVFEEMGRREDAVKQLQMLIRTYPKCFEAKVAKRQLHQWKPPADATSSD
jgi:tol-pal system protein YbgF